MPAALKDRRNKLRRRLNSLEKSAQAEHDSAAAAARLAAQEASLAQAKADVAGPRLERVGKLLARMEELKDELIELEPQLAEEELESIEGEADEIDGEDFFVQPSTRSEELPRLPDLTAYLKRKIVWRFGSLDLNHPKCWTEEEDAQALVAVVSKLVAYERNTWEEVEALSKHTHDWSDTSKWAEASQNRLAERKLDDQEGWYQLALTGKGRFFGYRTDDVFNAVWWDRDHEVYETKKKS